MKRINAKNKCVLIIGDLHLPSHHPQSIQFLDSIRCYLKEYSGKEPLVISIGDECDWQSVNFHEKDGYVPSSKIEYEQLLEMLHGQGGLYTTFSNMDILDSNHGSLLLRRIRYAKLFDEVMKPLSEIYQTKNWRWHNEIILETTKGDVYLCHGRSKNGLRLLNQVGTRGVIQGHYHSKFEICYYSRKGGQDRFSAFTGCLINPNARCFNYGSLHCEKPLLGSIAIMDDGEPLLFKMQLDGKGNWTGRL